MAAVTDFEPIFQRLKAILKKYEPRMIVTADEPGNYSLDAPMAWQGRSELFFGGVQIRKNYVSFHLIPVYVYPDLMQAASDGLRARMQGKSCFNFRSIDEPLFAELAALTERGIQTFRERGLPVSQKRFS
jgi:hypothetical protein